MYSTCTLWSPFIVSDQIKPLKMFQLLLKNLENQKHVSVFSLGNFLQGFWSNLNHRSCNQMPSKQETTWKWAAVKNNIGGGGETWHSAWPVSCWAKTIQHLGKLAFILKVSMYNEFFSWKVSPVMRNFTSCCWCMSFQNKIPVCGWCERREAFTQWVATTAFTGFTGLTGKYILMINNEATVLSKEARRRTPPPSQSHAQAPSTSQQQKQTLRDQLFLISNQ